MTWPDKHVVLFTVPSVILRFKHSVLNFNNSDL